MIQAQTSWEPPAGLTAHGGFAIGPEMDFFAPPPPEIGPVVSACSTLKKRRQPFSYAMRALIGLAAGAAMMLVAEILLRVLGNPPSYNGPMRIMFGVFAIVIAIVTFFALRFKHTCTYLGEQGAAEFKLSGSRDAISTQRVLVFSQADHVLVGIVQLRQHGIHTQTSFAYTWLDASRRTLFEIQGEMSKHKPYAPYHFSVAAEDQWTGYVLAKLVKQWQDHRVLDFATGRGMLRIVPGGLEYDNGRQVDAFGFDEVALDIRQGMIDFMPVAGGWRPRCSFEYNRFANVKAFLVCLEQIAQAGDGAPD